MFKYLRPLVFFPTFFILVSALILSLVDLEQFTAVTSALNSKVLELFSWLFSLGSFYLLVLVGLTYFSKLGDIRIGGENSTPRVTKPRWFMIVLCTTLAVGVLFWTTAEPIYHLHAPPESLGIEPGSANATLFAFSAMFLHWGPTPYAIYCVPALIFALAFYNQKMPFSISSSLRPVFGKALTPRVSDIIDALALYSLVVGMASSLGTGALTLLGGVSQFIELDRNALTLGTFIALIVATFVFSAASGLNKGIARLSKANFWMLIALFVFVLIFGPTVYMLSIGAEGLGAYLQNFFRLSLFTGQAANDPWPQWWSVFYWAVWFAWAPITAMFLGKIGRGYTVKEFIQVNLIFPSLFILFWVSVFSGTAVYLDTTTNGSLYNVLNNGGIEQLLYHIMDQLPMGGVTSFFLVLVAFISYVTAADSSTDAIGDLCTKDFTSESDEDTALPIKIVWGTLIGLVAWIMVSTVGINGVKQLSNLGGLPATLIILACSLTLIRWIKNPSEVQR
ncbi:TPA: BCCT family transporter [Vibrio parahaemolyticus]|uniref:BCCT family transporter n=1 Tax=Vibrio TaxID=662 RepID=UPI001B813170|nr:MULTISPECIES: BCCT family transporter [Vibrio]MEA3484326.1 BCCT family transporter [Pseudomonadota bacterium]EJE4203776.1 BCCT family transporter [Vibrio parahaemolyticus]ELA9243556.1 BCCT family transporter [Vibrio alginolyticus]ELA9245729.1 BCCT family transporter [Vibrio alginolyticus]ELB2779871.1 BCCT family transporter [Vibrio parahaemolyticus]